VTTAAANRGNHAGWHLLAFESEIGLGLSPCAIGNRRLMVLRGPEALRVFDASCPHRGADLTRGGRLVDGAVLCPFHGKRISLGCEGRLGVQEHETIRVGDAVFVRLSDDPAHDRGFRRMIKELAERGRVSAALTTEIEAPPELIIENAFDAAHFSAVHRVRRVTGMHAKTGPDGELVVEGVFTSHAPPWERDSGTAFDSRFLARAYSPGLVVTELGPPHQSHLVITATNPLPGTGTGCVARVALGIRADQEDARGALVAGARRAFDQDVEIWEGLDPLVQERLDIGDASVVVFREFCAGFPEVRCA
jgi:3-ketosteroid 9alpha-monooxygenase subunit A